MFFRFLFFSALSFPRIKSYRGESSIDLLCFLGRDPLSPWRWYKVEFPTRGMGRSIVTRQPSWHALRMDSSVSTLPCLRVSVLDPCASACPHSTSRCLVGRRSWMDSWPSTCLDVPLPIQYAIWAEDLPTRGVWADRIAICSASSRCRKRFRIATNIESGSWSGGLELTDCRKGTC